MTRPNLESFLISAARALPLPAVGFGTMTLGRLSTPRRASQSLPRTRGIPAQSYLSVAMTRDCIWRFPRLSPHRLREWLREVFVLLAKARARAIRYVRSARIHWEP